MNDDVIKEDPTKYTSRENIPSCITRKVSSIYPIPSNNDKEEEKSYPKRHCIWRWLCCSYCLPLWLACIIWFIVASVIICVIVVGALLASVETPKTQFVGINGTNGGAPQIDFSSHGFVINLGLLLNVDNPNVLALKLSNLNAQAYYAINETYIAVGDGTLDSLYLDKKSTQNITYPFQIHYDPSDKMSGAVLNNVIAICANATNPNATQSNIDLAYDVSLDAQVLFVRVKRVVSSDASFACPFKNGQLNGI